jgi:hypothetical protein
MQLRRQAMLAEAGQLQLQLQQDGSGNDDIAAAAAADLACFAGREDSSYRASLNALDKQVRGTAMLVLLGEAQLGMLTAWSLARPATSIPITLSTTGHKLCLLLSLCRCVAHAHAWRC